MQTVVCIVNAQECSQVSGEKVSDAYALLCPNKVKILCGKNLKRMLSWIQDKSSYSDLVRI